MVVSHLRPVGIKLAHEGVQFCAKAPFIGPAEAPPCREPDASNIGRRWHAATVDCLAILTFALIPWPFARDLSFVQPLRKLNANLRAGGIYADKVWRIRSTCTLHRATCKVRPERNERLENLLLHSRRRHAERNARGSGLISRDCVGPTSSLGTACAAARSGAATAPAGRAESHAVGWRVTRRRLGATKLWAICEWRDSQQDGPNAPGCAAR